MYTCPVCGYQLLAVPPAAYSICHCCGTEFEADDVDFSHPELTERWMRAGMPWFSRAVQPPPNWNPVQQLTNAGLVFRNSSLVTGLLK